MRTSRSQLSFGDCDPASMSAGAVCEKRTPRAPFNRGYQWCNIVRRHTCRSSERIEVGNSDSSGQVPSEVEGGACRCCHRKLVAFEHVFRPNALAANQDPGRGTVELTEKFDRCEIVDPIRAV
jgi:hypothetical protein